MSTGAVAGFKALLYAGNGPTATLTKIGEIQSADFKYDQNQLKATSHDSVVNGQCYDDYIGGVKSHTLAVQGLYVQSDAGRKVFLSILTPSGTQVDYGRFRIMPNTGVGTISGTARIKGLSYSAPNENPQTVSFDLVGVLAPVVS